MLKHRHVLPQLFLPVGHVEADSLKLGQVERVVDRARCDGARGVRVVVDGRHRRDLLAVAVSGLKDGAGDVRPALHGARNGTAVDAIGGRVPSTRKTASATSRWAKWLRSRGPSFPHKQLKALAVSCDKEIPGVISIHKRAIEHIDCGAINVRNTHQAVIL